MKKDHYQILGVIQDAEDIVIKAAYRALAQRYHPDKWAVIPFVFSGLTKLIYFDSCF